MLFSSITFLFGFLPLVVTVYYTLLRRNRRLQNYFLFLVSILFYAWGEPTFVFAMLLSILLNYWFGLFIGKHRENRARAKGVLAAAVFFNLLLLFVFKYLAFSITTLNQLHILSMRVPDIALPIGISFFTFQAMSYVIDVYRGEQHQTSLLNVGLYISFFPQLIAGPIVRYETVAEQIEKRRESAEAFYEGTKRFVIGLSKKVLLANTLAVVADTVFARDIAALSWATAWLGAIAYTLQIYFDFSGYSDMAIGLGRLFGFQFLENFNYPYISTSITEFWRRWHISLGTWFRDYLYIPLGGSRVSSKARLLLNLFLVWLLTGIWHGANWTFILWGMLYFVLLAAEKLTGINKKNSRAVMPLKYLYTIVFVILGWVLFRSPSVEFALRYIQTMFSFSNGAFNSVAWFYLKENLVCFAVAIVMATPFPKRFAAKHMNNSLGGAILVGGLYLAFLASVIYIVKGTYNPFIYFNF